MRISVKVKKLFLAFIFIFLIGCMTITDANADENEEHVYTIKINRLQNCITIYTKDTQTGAEQPYKSMTCSTALEIDNTPLGEYSITEKKDWGKLVDGSWGQYCCRITGQIMIHSVPYTAKRNDSLETEEYNKLGEPASLGCIRLRAVDAQWIYDNCSEGTQVIIYDDASAGPLGKPEISKIPEGYDSEGWDPTDTNEDNPWKELFPVINGVVDIEINEGDTPDFLSNVTVTDICGANIKDRLKVEGEYNVDEPGEYELVYAVTDGYDHSATSSFKLTVIEEEETTVVENAVPNQEYEKPKTGVGPIMKILFIAVCTFIISSLIIKKK